MKVSIGLLFISAAFCLTSLAAEEKQKPLKDDTGDVFGDKEQNAQESVEKGPSPIEFEEYKPSSYVFWEQFTEETKGRWVPSKVKSDEKDEEGQGELKESKLKYEGRWGFEEPTVLKAVNGDLHLVVKDAFKHHAISTFLDKPLESNGKDPLVLQYELKLQNNLECGGAYIKLLRGPNKDSSVEEKSREEGKGSLKKLEDFSNDTPYTIMFGPDKCGDSKVHFIFNQLNPLTKKYEEKHMIDAPMPYIDNLTHLYTLIVHPDNTFEVLIDNSVKAKGSLFEKFNPPVNPPKEIEDANDKKPEDWDENEKIVDKDAKKPEDWDEDAPKMIEDEKAVMPEDWLVDEPLLVEDPTAKKPEDWNDDMDGDWEPPTIENPKCSGVSGCGPWKKPLVENPNYKGKWVAPMIENPNYKGIWAPRKIANPDYYEISNPSEFASIIGLGFELWTLQDGISFDNIYLGNSVSEADKIAKEVWRKKFDKEVEIQSFENKASEKTRKNEPLKHGFSEKVLKLLIEFMTGLEGIKMYVNEGKYVEALTAFPLVTGVFGGAALLTFTAIFLVLSGGKKEKKAAKKTASSKGVSDAAKQSKGVSTSVEGEKDTGLKSRAKPTQGSQK
ncbi:Calnexin-like protein [Zancudomyces culisetae]|uniref:Calnexin-like protein n=1 Tax=Zancudomyces culisetae TaxID=1213189 RepID=A0A1R1PWH1_ZANCU|nr:Calnexin-like protein [Zancudomyces culisetae]|eukprot:OMH85345.1 Calnexin-like protein [Zancudomyces culisetae]